ncbi:DUF2628 domain-containing protein [Devosia rhodophyticola]|uniref:DUF2628 domain-containing protein n=1 Tax=Devosia rhodophyticola TaxID=3026423 RepID=A0ABY7Z152_9HYPH|nr:DUF2628 domain-containing protein [Devosia rhodophyticola]WDR07368.1 DUF2628 domain-containing protein [Devosia rhodophyticola]
MTIFAIYESRPDNRAAPVAVAEKFSWLAFLLPPVFAVVHGLWLELLVYLVKVAALIWLSNFIGADTAILLYPVLALWIGLSAPAMRRARLARKGWNHRADRIAAGPDIATLAWMERR